MTILLTLWVAGMPPALAIFIYVIQGVPREDAAEIPVIGTLAAVSLWVLLWPYWLAKILCEVWQER